MEHIALERIPHKKIRAFIQEQINNRVQSVKDLQVSFRPGDCTKKFLKHEEVFEAKYNIDTVWDSYNKTGLNSVFTGSLVSFALMLSKRNELDVLYKEETFSATEVGQVYFMNLSVLKGIIQIAVSYEIVVKNEEERVLEFAYIKGGKSIGFQRIKLDSVGNNRTRITHTTHYRSQSKFRDRFIYPYFHTKVLEEYHTNMLNYMDHKLVG
jgi:hypothetical protein